MKRIKDIFISEREPVGTDVAWIKPTASGIDFKIKTNGQLYPVSSEGGGDTPASGVVFAEDQIIHASVGGEEGAEINLTVVETKSQIAEMMSKYSFVQVVILYMGEPFMACIGQPMPGSDPAVVFVSMGPLEYRYTGYLTYNESEDKMTGVLSTEAGGMGAMIKSMSGLGHSYFGDVVSSSDQRKLYHRLDAPVTGEIAISLNNEDTYDDQDFYIVFKTDSTIPTFTITSTKTGVNLQVLHQENMSFTDLLPNTWYKVHFMPVHLPETWCYTIDKMAE